MKDLKLFVLRMSREFQWIQSFAQTILICNCLDLLCTLTTCDLTLAHFDYLPSLAGNALYAALFAGCLVVQLVLGIRYRSWGFMTAAVRICSRVSTSTPFARALRDVLVSPCYFSVRVLGRRN